MLLSDIAVHREQMGSDATYFGTDDAEGLAAKMRDAISSEPVARPIRKPDAQSAEPVRRFARDFAMAVDEAFARCPLKRVA